MSLSPEIIKQLHQVFNGELDEQCQIMTESLLQLEQAQSDDPARQAMVDQLFRSAHNIKGASRGVELQTISAVAHELEELFTRISQSTGDINPAAIDFALQTIDLMLQLMQAENNQQNLPVDLDMLSHQATTMAVDLLDTSNNPKPAQSPPQEAASELEPALAPETEPSAELTPELESEPELEPEPKAQQPKPAPPQQTQSPKRRANDRTKSPSSYADKPDKTTDASRTSLDTEVIRLKMDKLSHIDSLSEDIQGSKMAMQSCLSRLSALNLECRHLSDQFNQWYCAEQQDLDSNHPELQHYQQAQLQQKRHQQIQHQTALNQLSQEIGRLTKDFRICTRQLKTHSNSMQSSVRMLRLIPASSLLQSLGRIVRDIARTLGKQVHFVTTGDDIEVDRTVLAGLKDPLIHLLRNAIDHGLQTPEERRADGKNEVGQLSIDVRRDGSEIVMKISDDGVGIDIEKIMEQALKRKIYTEDELLNMGLDELIDIIFMPGFSTKSLITDISGRGVGMDAVADKLSRLKGRISVQSAPVQGTQFYLRVPVTMATERGLLVRLGRTQYLIPTQAVLRVMEIQLKDIIDVEACHTIYHDNKPVPLCDLARLLALQPSNISAKTSGLTNHKVLLPIVMVSKGRSCVAFMIDEILGETEVIVKPLQPPLISVKNISGGAIMGNGDIVMVLEPNDLVEHGLQRNAGQQLPLQKAASKAAQAAAKLLVVDDSITVRTLEQNILQAQGYDVSIAADGQQAWDLLQTQLFDLIVTDVQMPRMDGFELTRQIKQSDDHRHIPVVMVTSLEQQSDKEKGVEAGANAYIVKGQFETRSLIDIIAQLLLTHGIETLND